MLRDDTDMSIIVLGLVLFYTEKPRDVHNHHHSPPICDYNTTTMRLMMCDDDTQ